MLFFFFEMGLDYVVVPGKLKFYIEQARLKFTEISCLCLLSAVKLSWSFKTGFLYVILVCSINQADLKLRDLSASASKVLGSKVVTICLY